MNRFYFALALLASLFSLSTAETIVYDSLHLATIELPTVGGNPTASINLPNGHKNTSPYYIHVAINDGDATSPNGYYAGEAEYFYLSPAMNGMYGDGTIINQTYSPTWEKNLATTDDRVLGNYVGTEAFPSGLKGTYTFCFFIPPQGTLVFNITYFNNATATNDLEPIVETVFVSIFNGASQVTGDPQFVGLRGQSYQVHGIDGAVYNIISEQNTQVNSRFVFLTEGQCPMINGKPDVNCWSHPGSYLGEMSFQAIVDGKTHAALIEAGPAQKGFAGVQVDGKALTVGDIVTFGDFSVELTSTHTVAVTTENYAFELSNSDMFINQALRATTPLSKLTSHGLLGQTHSTKTYATAIKYIDGEVDDYVIQDGNIYGTDFLFNRFNL